MKKAKQGSEHELIIKIKVEPRSSRSSIIGMYGDALKVKLTSAPVDGKANKELMELLAKELGIRKKDVEIMSGETSRNKVVKLIGVKSLEDFLKPPL
ncbi:MAG: YggU family protein [Nitrospirae bacterium]|nr:YggU family protein [Nitrospirota bacterium]